LNDFRELVHDKVPLLKTMRPRAIIIASAVAAILVVALWAFPSFWYTKSGPGQFTWLTENTNIAGWTYAATPVEKSQEAALDADKAVSGEFKNGSEVVQVFAAKRFSDDPNAIGLFVHTPDRCWVESGWKLKPASPETAEIDFHGTKLICERRVFVWRTGEEVLVYFGGLSAGQPLPYRLDHNLSVGQKSQMNATSRSSQARTRAVDTKFWARIWDVFQSRQQMVGPKQFVRLATPTGGRDAAAADERLKMILERWLQPGDFAGEFGQWQKSKPRT
jgi:hypothetical protein